MKMGSLRREQENLPGQSVLRELLEIIEYLLVVDHSVRPTAEQALGHAYLRSVS